MSDLRLFVLTPTSAFVEVPGTRTPGEARYDRVPEGERYLRRGSAWYVGFPPQLDLSTDTLGRPNPGVSDGGTTLRLDVSGLSEWRNDSAVDLYAFNAGVTAWSFSFFPSLALGSTSGVVDVSYDDGVLVVMNPPVPLIRTSQGDEVQMTQMQRRQVTTDAGTRVDISELRRAASISQLDLASGQRSEARAHFEVPPLTTTMTLALNRSAYWGVAEEVVPGANAPFWLSTVEAMPFTGERGPYATGGELISTVGFDKPNDRGELLLVAAANDPFPPSWVRSATFLMCFGAKTSGGYRTSGCLATTGRVNAMSEMPMSPMLSPPTKLQVDGRPGFDPAERTLASMTPVISWAPPRSGRPVVYSVRVRELDSATNSSTQIARLVTPRTAITLPPGLLKAHAKYAFRVEAYQGANRLLNPLPRHLAPKRGTNVMSSA